MAEQNMIKMNKALQGVTELLNGIGLTRDETMTVVVSIITQLIVNHSDWTVEWFIKSLKASVENGVADARAKRSIQ